MQAVLERYFGTPAELVLRWLDVATGSAYVTIPEFRYDCRFRGVADAGELASQLADSGRAARPNVEAAWLRRRRLNRRAHRVDDIIDKDEIAHDPTVFIDLQRTSV